MNRFRTIRVHLSNELFNDISKMAKDKKISISRTMGHLLDAALENNLTYLMDIEIPKADYETSSNYTEQCANILSFIKTFKYGASKEVIVHFRKFLGVDDLKILGLCIAELLDCGIIITCKNEYCDEVTYLYKENFKPKGKRTIKREIDEFEQYLKLKKRYEVES